MTGALEEELFFAFRLVGDEEASERDCVPISAEATSPAARCS